MMTIATALTTAAAVAAGYSDADLKAGIEHYMRKHRLSHPPGAFDRAGRFTAHERTSWVTRCRQPSRAHRYPQMKAARTARHCAERHDANPLHVGRIARSLEIEAVTPVSAHERLQVAADIRRVIKKALPPAARGPAD